MIRPANRPTRSRDVARARHALLDRASQLADHAAEQRRRHDGWTTPLLVAGGWDAWRAVASADPGTLEAAIQSDLATAAAERASVGTFPAGDAVAHEGRLHAVRGAAGELETLERIGAGRVAVPAGTDQVELLSFTAPGADLLLHSSTGPVYANVKMTGTADPLLEHLRRHPDVPLLYASRDAATDAARRGLRVVGAEGPVPGGVTVVDTGISVADLDAEVATVAGSASTAGTTGPSLLNALAEGPLDGLWDIGAAVAELAAPLSGIMPIGTVLVVGARAGLRSGASTRRDATTAGARLLRAASSSLAAKGVTAISHEPTLGLVAALTTSIALGGLPGARRSWLDAADEERRVGDWARRR